MPRPPASRHPSSLSSSSSLHALAARSTQVADAVERLGDYVQAGTPLADAVVAIMDAVLDLDMQVHETRAAVAYMGSGALARAHLAAEDELQALRREREADQEELQALRREREAAARKCDALEERVQTLRLLNNMLMDRERRSATPSSGFGSSSEEAASPEAEEPKGDEAAVPDEPSSGGDEATPQLQLMHQQPEPPQKPARRRCIAVRFDEREREREAEEEEEEDSGPTFKDSIRLLPRPLLAPPPALDLDDTLVLSETTDEHGEGPLSSTLVNDESVYFTPAAKPRNMRRRSSSVGDFVKKIFTPNKKNRVKNPILEVME